MPVEITPRAAERFCNLLHSQPDKVVRLLITAGGCNGFKKNLEITNREHDDIVVSFSNGMLAMDPLTAEIAGDAVIDWVTGIVGSYFDIKVPTAGSSCGCGDSFSL